MGIVVENAATMAARPLHTFLYGAVRSGKTTAASTWPNPVFISAGNEGGDTTLRFTKSDVIRVNTKNDVVDALKYIETHGKAKHNWRTIVLDSVTYISDLFIAECTGGGTRPMKLQEWGLLDLFLQKYMLPVLMKLPYHVVWIALEEADRGADGVVQGYKPMLFGKSKDKLPGACDLIVRTTTQSIRNSKGVLETQHMFKTLSFDNSPAGGRFGAAFADGSIPAHFGAIAQRIGPWIGEEIPKQ